MKMKMRKDGIVSGQELMQVLMKMYGHCIYTTD